MILSRRQAGRLLSGALFPQWMLPRRALAAPNGLHVDRLLGEHPYVASINQSRAYRADAVISLLSVPIFSRTGVGSGFAGFRQAKRGDVSITTLRFAGGSLPQKAHNLNRLGLVQEVVVEKDGNPMEAAYFGFMTASPEEGMGEARRSIETSSAEVPYVAVEGLISGGHFRATKTRFLFSNQSTWADRASILSQVRSRFATTEAEVKNMACPGDAWPGTFLYAMAQAIARHPARFQAGYVYNAKHFHLELDKTADAKMGASFAAKGLTARPESVSQFRGVIHDERTGKLTKFRVWTEEGSDTPLPLRIELQARSFLALAFEFDPTLQSHKESQDP